MAITYSLDEIETRDMAVLRIQGELDFTARSDFQDATKALLASSLNKLVVDLTQVTQISSLFIGSLIDAGIKAKAEKRSLAVMAPRKLVRLCNEVGLNKAATVITV